MKLVVYKVKKKKEIDEVVRVELLKYSSFYSYSMNFLGYLVEINLLI